MITKNNNGFTLIEFFILLLIISGLAGIINSDRIKSSKNKEEKECFNNQRLLIGAIEIYKDDTTKIENIYPGLDYENFEKELLKNKYCLREPLKPTFKGCSYGFVGENASATVFCKVHGTIKQGRRHEQKPIPEYDKNLEKPFSPSYNDFRNKIINERQKEQKHEDLINSLLFILTLPGLICLYLLENYLVVIIILLGIFSTIYWLSFFSKKKKAC